MTLSNPQQEASGYVTAAWVKQRYSIANSTLYYWIANNRLPAPVKLGPRAIRFRLDDLLAFEARLTTRNDQGNEATSTLVETSVPLPCVEAIPAGKSRLMNR